MKPSQFVTLIFAAALLSACKPSTETDAPAVAESSTPNAAVIELPVRYSVIDLAELDSPLKLTALCESENQLMLDHMASLESFEGKFTVDGYYKSYDSLTTSLDNMTSYAQSLSAVHPDPELRTAGENCEQLLSEIGTDLSLSRPIYDAVSQLDVNNETPATKHSVEKTLLGFRLSGVDKDDATRERIRELNTQLVNIGLDRSRNDIIMTIDWFRICDLHL